LPAVILGGSMVGLLFQSPFIGQLALAVYGLAVLVFRIESRYSFALALAALCVLVTMLLFSTSKTIATNFALYTFILLIIGVASLLREVRERYA
jgi:hypothetical protein